VRSAAPWQALWQPHQNLNQGHGTTKQHEIASRKLSLLELAEPSLPLRRFFLPNKDDLKTKRGKLETLSAVPEL
jgi:hypothetical protein